MLQSLALDQALRAVHIAYEQAESDFVAELVKQISIATDLKTALADKVVRRLAKFYDLQNVAIYKVNALRGYFSLLAQECGGRRNAAAVPAN